MSLFPKSKKKKCLNILQISFLIIYASLKKTMSSHFFLQNQETVQILYDEAASVMGKDRVVAAYDLLSISVPLKSS